MGLVGLIPGIESLFGCGTECGHTSIQLYIIYMYTMELAYGMELDKFQLPTIVIEYLLLRNMAAV